VLPTGELQDVAAQPHRCVRRRPVSDLGEVCGELDGRDPIEPARLTKPRRIVQHVSDFMNCHVRSEDPDVITEDRRVDEIGILLTGGQTQERRLCADTFIRKERVLRGRQPRGNGPEWTNGLPQHPTGAGE
jgi:hypothetical protein